MIEALLQSFLSEKIFLRIPTANVPEKHQDVQELDDLECQLLQ